jgi:uncharacterized protein (DUF1800 family)
VAPEPDRTEQLADLFRGSGLGVGPVVAAILRHPSFLEQRLTRPREPVEWVAAAIGALDIRDPQVAYDTCVAMGQVPFRPPSVAGWPQGQRWLGASLALVRAGVAVTGRAADDVAGAADPVEAALRHCGLYEVTDSTTESLRQAASAVNDAQLRASLLIALAVASPEFALA